MPVPPHRPPPGARVGRDLDPALRELLVFLRDTFLEAATRIERYIAPDAASGAPHDWRDVPDDDRAARGPAYAPRAGRATGIRMPLEALRDETRQISNGAADMDPAEMRLRVEAVTAETRSLQNRATDPEDQDIAAKILRALTAIVSEHRPGHVYGLARHHDADWDDVARRAREELASHR